MEKLQTVFIFGVCGAGKSTMARQLAEILPAAQFSVCEFDYPGVPSNTPDTWRAERTETWLRIAVENARSNISTVICGLVHPDEVLAASSVSLVPPIRFIFLEATDDEIAGRLRERYAIPLSLNFFGVRTISPQRLLSPPCFLISVSFEIYSQMRGMGRFS